MQYLQAKGRSWVCITACRAQCSLRWILLSQPRHLKIAWQPGGQLHLRRPRPEAKDRHSHEIMRGYDRDPSVTRLLPWQGYSRHETQLTEYTGHWPLAMGQVDHDFIYNHTWRVYHSIPSFWRRRWAGGRADGAGNAQWRQWASCPSTCKPTTPLELDNAVGSGSSRLVLQIENWSIARWMFSYYRKNM